MENRENYAVDRSAANDKTDLHTFVIGKPGKGQELKTLPIWAKKLGLQLPEDYKPDLIMRTYKEACAVFVQLGLFPEKPVLNPIQIVMLAAFPTVEQTFHAKIQEGFKHVTFSYESDQTNSEKITIVFYKDYERFVLTQEKGHYAGGFSHATFGREGERGETV